MPVRVKKEEMVSLEQLRQETTKEKLNKMLGAKYDGTLKEFVAGLSKEARNMERTKSDPESLRKLADMVENSGYLEVTITELRHYPKSIPKKYLEKIGGLLGRAEELTASGMLRGIADIAEEAEEDGIRIIPKISIKPNEDLIKELKKMKSEFAEDISTIISSGLNGKTTEPFRITFNDEKTAGLFFTSLKEIGLEKPETEGRVPFKEAAVPKGKYPLEVRLAGKTVEISWPDWLAVGKSYLANMVPEKTTPR